MTNTYFAAGSAFQLIKRLLLWFLLFFYLPGCDRNQSHIISPANIDSVFNRLEQQYKKTRSREYVLAYIDSLYESFPQVSEADQFRRLNFKRKLFRDLHTSTKTNDTILLLCDSSIRLLEKAQLSAQFPGEYADLFHEKGDCYYDLEKFDSSISNFFRCSSLASAERNYCTALKGLEGQMRVAARQYKYSYAVEIAQKALGITGQCGDKSSYFYYKQRILDDLGFMYMSMNKLDSAVEFHQQAADFVDRNKALYTNDSLFAYRALTNIYTNLCVDYIRLKNDKDAVWAADKGIEAARKITDDSTAYFGAVNVKIQVLVRLKMFGEAHALLQSLKPLLKKVDGRQQVEILHSAIDIAKGLHNNDDWMWYTNRYYYVRDSMMRREMDILIKDPATQLERIDKEYQVKLLRNQNQLKQNQLNAGIIIGILLVAIVILFLVLFRRIRKIMKKKNILFDELQEREGELRIAIEQLAVQEKQKREEELYFQEVKLQMQHKEEILSQKRKISDDLHDDLSSSLAALNFYIQDLSQHAKNADDKNSLLSVKTEVESIYKNARAYMHSLQQNVAPSQFDLVSLLEEMHHKFSTRTTLQFLLDLDKEALLRDLSVFQMDQLYHIVNEAIGNVLKHARATVISISLKVVDGKCEFSIADNGKGFSDKAGAPGLGIRSMQKRIRELDGEISFANVLAGTTVKGYFPLS